MRTSDAAGTRSERSRLRVADHATTIGLAALTLLLAAAVVLDLTGSSPFLLLATVAAASTAGLAARLGWAAAAALVVMGAFAALLVLTWWGPLLGLPFRVTASVVLYVVGAVSLADLWWRRRDLRPPSAGQWVDAAVSTLPSAAMWAILEIARGRSGLPKLSWLMQNDAPFNLILARFILADDGVDPGLHDNPVPTTAGIIAWFMAPGRADLGPAAMLRHDLARSSDGLMFVTAAISVIAAITVLRTVRERNVVLRAAVGLAAALIPWTWAAFGFAVRYGFWNALPTVLLLLCLWIAWIESAKRPVLGSALVALAGLTLLATWGPLVAAPAAMWVAIAARSRRQLLALRGRALALWLVPHVLLLAYVVFRFLPSLRLVGAEALGGDGAFFGFSMYDAIAAASGLALAALIVVAATGRGWMPVGVAVLLVAGFGGAAYLVHQRLSAGLANWGYYPAKYAWLWCVAAAVIAIGLVADLDARGDGRDAGGGSAGRRLRTGAAGAAAIVLAALMLSRVSPADLRPPSLAHPALDPAPDWSLDTVLPVLSIAGSDGMSDQDDVVRAMLVGDRWADRTLFSQYFGDPYRDGLANYWLLQLHSPTATGGENAGMDPIRSEAYTHLYSLVAEDPKSVCATSRAWGGGVRVLTRNPDLRRALEKACPGLRLDVDVVK
ncbi:MULTISPECIES: hypothetical protein [unclassified Nocardioides]|uniref:hypothetical protein n=1 Tax=unclassified Nocardioides TaxID=2615069 RepID=UPI003616752F